MILVFILSWFIIGFLCATLVLKTKFEKNDEITVLDLFFFIVFMTLGYSSIVFLVFMYLDRWGDKIIIYKKKRESQREDFEYDKGVIK